MHRQFRSHDHSYLKRENIAGPLEDSCYCIYRTVVTVFTGQLLLCLQDTCHCVYRTVVTVFTGQLSLCLQDSCYCVYRTVVTVFTGQLLLYSQDSCYCVYRTVVTVFTGQLLLYFSTVLTLRNSAVQSRTVRLREERSFPSASLHTACVLWEGIKKVISRERIRR
jgi:hypothetical protein